MKSTSIMKLALAATVSSCFSLAMAAPAKKKQTAAVHVRSQFDQGIAAYERGDWQSAYRLFRPLADQGDAYAQFNLGVMYDNGQGVAQDYFAAVSWYRKAAEQGIAGAQFNLGLMYFNGQGVLRDYVQAYKWFNLSAAGAKGAEKSDNATKVRDLVSEWMTPAQIAEAQRLASEWKKK